MYKSRYLIEEFNSCYMSESTDELKTSQPSKWAGTLGGGSASVHGG